MLFVCTLQPVILNTSLKMIWGFKQRVECPPQECLFMVSNLATPQNKVNWFKCHQVNTYVLSIFFAFHKNQNEK